jgi:rRNA-processing protein FCF1
MEKNKTPIQQIIDSIKESKMEVIKTSAVIEALNLMKTKERQNIIDAFHEGLNSKANKLDFEAGNNYYLSKYK